MNGLWLHLQTPIHPSFYLGVLSLHMQNFNIVGTPHSLIKGEGDRTFQKLSHLEGTKNVARKER